ncbi:MAG: hypothetical protein K8T20_20010 [Planctomycetes bacterium]|nr:hypothetical protein [Planctomycetota bacterium]
MSRASALLVAALLAGCGGGKSAVPSISDPVVATLAGGPVRLKGHGFGTPRTGAFLVIGDGIGLSTTSWTDDAIELTLPASARCGPLTVVTPEGIVSVPLEIYAYDGFSIPVTEGTNACPLAVAVDGAGRVWINSEFHKGDFHFFDPGTGKVVAVPVPGPPAPGVYATKIFGDNRTTISMCGEDVIVDPRGRVWFTEGGGYLYDGVHPNHSRVVCYEPAEKSFRIYNVPGDQNEIIGILWDAKRGLIWFAQGGLKAGAKIWSLDPEAAFVDNTFDFSTPADAKGFRSWDLPLKDDQPSHLALDPDGSLWYSAYWRNRIGRLVPETGEIREVPLPKGIGRSKPGQLVGGGPWTLFVRPDGSLTFVEFFDSQLTRIDAARVRAGDAACFALDGKGRNPCILQSFVVPDADLAAEFVHSAAYDAQGRFWYTIHGEDKPGCRASLGFVTADWKSIVRLPPLPGDGPLTCDGIAIDPKTGDIWFAEFLRHRLGRLRRQ